MDPKPWIEARVARCILMTQDRAEHDELLLTHDLLSMKLGVRRPGVTVAVQVLEGKGLTQGCRAGSHQECRKDQGR
jgi:hypothetical protein